VRGAALGRARVRALAAHLLGGPRETTDPELARWAQGFPPAGLQGLQEAGIPDDYREVLGWVGMPCCREGTVRWGLQVRQADPGATAPVLEDAVLWLPAPARLRACSAIALRPLRAFVARHWRCRLQAAGGIHCWYWPDTTVLISTREQVLCGFLHGPTSRQRATIRLAPGEYAQTRW